MNAEIEARPAIDETPRHEADRSRKMAKGETQEDGNGHCVGGVRRKETVHSSPIVAHGIDKLHDGGVVRGTQAADEGLENAACHLVADVDAKGKAGNYDARVAPISCLPKEVENAEIKHAPRSGLGENPCEVVEPNAVASVEKKRDVRVEGEECFHKAENLFVSNKLFVSNFSYEI